MQSKKPIRKKTGRRIKSVVSVLVSLILATTPIYSDEMQMEEYVDHDSGGDSYDSYDDCLKNIVNISEGFSAEYDVNMNISLKTKQITSRTIQMNQKIQLFKIQNHPV